MARIRSDDLGLYIKINGTRHRPGAVADYAYSCDMSRGGLRAGDTVEARHVSQSPLCRIVLSDRILYWASPQSMWGRDSSID